MSEMNDLINLKTRIDDIFKVVAGLTAAAFIWTYDVKEQDQFIMCCISLAVYSITIIYGALSFLPRQLLEDVHRALREKVHTIDDGRVVTKFVPFSKALCNKSGLIFLGLMGFLIALVQYVFQVLIS